MIENIHFDIENEYNEIAGLEFVVVAEKLDELASEAETEKDALKSSMIKWAVVCDHKRHFDYDDLVHLMTSSETCGLCMFFNTCSECCEYTEMEFDDRIKCFKTFSDAFVYRRTGEKNNTVYHALERVYNRKYGIYNERHGSE